MAELIWDRLARGWANMAERFDELICNFDTGESTMEVTTVLLVGWAIFCVLLVALGRYVNQRFLQPPASEDTPTKATEASSEKTAAAPTPTTAAPTPTKAKPKTPTGDGASSASSFVHAAASKAPAGVGGAPAKGAAVRRRNSGGGPGPASAPLTFATSFPPASKGPAPVSPVAAVVLRDVPNLPFATGSERDAVSWVDNILKWVYTDPTPTPDMHRTWLDALNQVASKLGAENGIQLLFQEILADSELPTLTNVMADPGPGEDIVNILSDVDSTVLGFVVQVTRQMGESFWQTEYTCHVDSLSGPLSVACDINKLTGTAHFDCRPRIKLSVIPNPRTKLSNPIDEQALQTVVNEIICGAISHTSVDFHCDKYTSCPRYIRTKVVVDPVLPVHYDSMIPSVQTIAPPKKIAKKGRRLLVKVVKANNLGSDKGCSSPFCSAELDEPSQKHTTAATNGQNPFWDEHFLFDLSEETGEILFELWDKNPQEGKSDRFLGLGIVSVDDLLRTPSQRQILTLQSRPYEGDDISGSLTVEFLCMESAEIPHIEAVKQAESKRPPRPPPPSPAKVIDSSRTVSPGGTVITTTTTFRKPTLGPPEVSNKIEIEKSPDASPVPEVADAQPPESDDILVNGEDTVTSTALRELAKPKPERPPAITTDKSTLIIHSVQREVIHPTLKVEKARNGTWHEVTQGEGGDGSGLAYGTDSTTSLDEHGNLDNDRSRTKERKSFMSTLKKRLSFRNKRSRSVEQQQEGTPSRDSSGSRSASIDRAHSFPSSREGSSAPSSGKHLAVENTGSRAENLSARSSLSEMSAVSGSSTQTYVDEASMLVIEALENGIVKHYLVPGSLANKSKWRKRGVKLHIFNEHTFVAKHLPSNSICQVCNKPFIRRIGKQGYECRDCQMTCHKPCHVRTDTHCPSSRVGSMELVRDWWVDMPLPPSSERHLSLKHRIQRLGQRGLEPIPSNDKLNSHEGNDVAYHEKKNKKQKKQKTGTIPDTNNHVH